MIRDSLRALLLLSGTQMYSSYYSPLDGAPWDLEVALVLPADDSLQAPQGVLTETCCGHLVVYHHHAKVRVSPPRGPLQREREREI